MICKECIYFRGDIVQTSDMEWLTERYDEKISPCNRYPQNVYRNRMEPACGEGKSLTMFN